MKYYAITLSLLSLNLAQFNNPNLPIMKTVSFYSGDNNLQGHLYLPANFNESEKYAAVVVGGSLTSVKEQMAGIYAAKLAENGLVALAFDFSNYGESEGTVRQFEDPQQKVRDLSAAISYLETLPFVKGTGALGVCTAGGNVAYLAAEDDRLQAAVTVAAWLPNEEALPLLYGGQEQVVKLRTEGQNAANIYEASGANEIILAYHNTDTSASHVGPMEYYMDTNRGGGVTQWKNEFSVMSWEPWLAFDPMSKAAAIDVPFMMIHSDGSALPNNAKEFFEQLAGPKELVWGDGDHFDYYDQAAQVEMATQRASEFLKMQIQ
ncbi:MAG: alpha/beta hydrolase [Bacteroidota bacterium]